jgi:carboxylesterase
MSAPIAADEQSERNAGAMPFSIGTGPDACLLLHGLTGAPSEMRPLGDLLAARGIHCVAPLLPGHGVAPEALFGLTRSDLLEAAHQALRELRSARRIYLAGLSFGALLAIQLAARQRLRNGDPEISKLALLAPAIRFASSTWLLAELFGRLPLKDTPLMLPKGAGRDVFGVGEAPLIAVPGVAAEANPDRLAGISQPIAVPLLAGARAALDTGVRADGSLSRIPASWGRELRLLSEESLALAPRVRAPTLIVQGGRDRTANPAGAQLLSRRLGSRIVELRVFPEGGHVLPIDGVGPEVCAVIGSFFAA